MSVTWRADLEREGFVVLPGFVDDDACDSLMRRAAEIVDEFDARSMRSIFTTDERERVYDAYFLASGDKVRCFFESDAVDESGSLVVDKGRSINKIGHAMHDLDPTFNDFSRTSDLEELAAALGYADPLLLQSMFIFKHPEIGGEVGVHQDATFLYTEPNSTVGLWFALQDARIDNACLWVVPGGHHHGLARRNVRSADGGTTFVELAGGVPDSPQVPLEVDKGTLVVLDGLLPHRSDANHSARSRQAYTLHLIERAAEYPADNWLRRAPDMPLRGFGSRDGTYWEASS